MDVRALALRVVESDRLDDKLAPWPTRPVDRDRGEPRWIAAPGRPPELRMVPAREARVPPVEGMRDPAQRARILHALANHELQAVELFAWALLAFPGAPALFRRGLVAILRDEQRHCGLYIERLAALGRRMGDFPVTGHFWKQLGQMTGPRAFVCVMGLTFENANLDFAQDYARAARAAGDEATAGVLEVVHRDEIRHVRFAWRWLERWRREESAWDAYRGEVKAPLGPARARGKVLCVESRRAAGLDEDFIAQLAASDATRPSGAPR
ncbi:MAG TPA: DUF455 family protein [Kofleriaceae bacterium]|nr:DUF455 family protein [Kofleriaceae bacterium]